MRISALLRFNIRRNYRKVKWYSALHAGLYAVILLFALACQEQSTMAPGDQNQGGNAPVVTPEILSVLPHDGSAFTQGLLYHAGHFYESSGRYGQSTFRKVNIQTGEILFVDSLPNNFFGEGLALFDDRFIQLTWRSGVGIVYDAGTLTAIDTVRYDGEGWGLTTNDVNYIMSNGSAQIVFREANFQTSRTINVTLDGSPVNRLNELEYDGKHIFANVWLTDRIMVISPEKGEVVKVVDCSELVAIEQPAGPDNVLNGIAYRPDTGTFFLTGKNWRRMFEVRIPAPE